MSNRTILPLTYLGNVQWFAHLLADDCVIDIDEYYIKQSYRNRTVIAAANGLMPLTVQVANANRPRMKMRDVRIDYSKRWQKQHWGALVAAYKASPYFDYYVPRLERFYTAEYASLAEFNLALIAELCAMLGIAPPSTSESYLTATSEDLDLRPKQKGPAFRTEPYIQVFSDRQPYVANLSIVDLIFNEGPAALGVLRRCQSAW